MPSPRSMKRVGTAIRLTPSSRRNSTRKGLVPAPHADKRTLVRRAYLDVLGLLPSPSDVKAFVNERIT